MSAAQPFWLRKTLAEMTQEEWESLCDGCGRCCLHKLEDEDTGDVYYTDVACRYLDEQSCRCKDYVNRQSLVPECLTLTYEKLASVDWLPDTCAYRLLAEGKPLRDWHPLVSGRADSTLKAGVAVRGRCINEEFVAEEDLEEHIIHWVN